MQTLTTWDANLLCCRTSGTEPKIKYYLEGSGADGEKVLEVLNRVVEVLGRDWMEAEKHGLLKP